MKKITTMLGSVLLVSMLAACGNESPDNGENTTGPIHVDQPTNSGKGNMERGFEVLTEGLKSPWAIDFSGDLIYISERDGAIVRMKDGRLTRQKLQLSSPVKQEGEGGLLGFVLTADFSTTKEAYIYYTYEKGDELFNRVAIIAENGDASGWEEKRILLDGIPGASNHDGGRLAIGPDQCLYITTGDAQHEDHAQDLDSLAGKILRMAADGSVPEDNPFDGSYVYSYGHRNPQGLAWNNKGELFSSEHGPSSVPGGHDELNKIEPGLNYGWPEVIGDERKEGMTPPVYHTGDDTLAPSGMTANDRGEWLVTGLRGESLVKFAPDGSTHEVLITSEGRLRDVKIHNDAVYVITNNTDGRGDPGKGDDRLIRLTGH
ncbi:PQQ-dependent sugar dehydrogenase [Paenibacillus nasutitermitis]|uniref:Dehydrogenase n=1 Tax=Paenibacillus nasutitermitis TaxID=1652958 RepID=A0A916ZGC9_9BACL|nr:PQQ-dependent sugar dehydrogenase [Paenibacillus nasutitermitis]GGD94088.1 dehydrogenase [Paenibacillus nasutitermitis]